MIVKSLYRPYIYFLFRDDNTEIEFEKKPKYAPKTRGNNRLTEKEKQLIKRYFK